VSEPLSWALLYTPTTPTRRGGREASLSAMPDDFKPRNTRRPAQLCAGDPCPECAYPLVQRHRRPILRLFKREAILRCTRCGFVARRLGVVAPEA
jgi:hypothetical protein